MIVQMYEEASKRLNMLKFVSYKVCRSTLTSVYKGLIRPLVEYGDVILFGTTVMIVAQLSLILFNMKLQDYNKCC